MGRSALSIHPGAWKHGQTDHFFIHFFDSFIATPVSVEAEFYFRYIASDLGLTPTGADKSHIYIFESPEDWKRFQSVASLEKWTGGIHVGNDLFIVRNPAFRFKGHALGHEIVHLVVHKYVGNLLPKWLEEGYAEDASIRGYSTFYRERGYLARPKVPVIAPGKFIPLSQLTQMVGYPPESQVDTFYDESHRLVWFLGHEDKAKLIALLKNIASQGTGFESALHDAYGLRWVSLDALEKEMNQGLSSTQ